MSSDCDERRLQPLWVGFVTDAGNPLFRAIREEARMVPNKASYVVVMIIRQVGISCDDNEASGNSTLLVSSSGRWVG